VVVKRVGLRAVVEGTMRVKIVHGLSATGKASTEDVTDSLRELIESCQDWLDAIESTHKPVDVVVEP
jgi:hypothetical protein